MKQKKCINNGWSSMMTFSVLCWSESQCMSFKKLIHLQGLLWSNKKFMKSNYSWIKVISSKLRKRNIHPFEFNIYRWHHQRQKAYKWKCLQKAKWVLWAIYVTNQVTILHKLRVDWEFKSDWWFCDFQYSVKFWFFIFFFLLNI